MSIGKGNKKKRKNFEETQLFVESSSPSKLNSSAGLSPRASSKSIPIDSIISSSKTKQRKELKKKINSDQLGSGLTSHSSRNSILLSSLSAKVRKTKPPTRSKRSQKGSGLKVIPLETSKKTRVKKTQKKHGYWNL